MALPFALTHMDFVTCVFSEGSARRRPPVSSFTQSLESRELRSRFLMALNPKAYEYIQKSIIVAPLWEDLWK